MAKKFMIASLLFCLGCIATIYVVIPRVEEYKLQKAAEARTEKLEQAKEYMRVLAYKNALSILVDLCNEPDLPHEEKELYWNYRHYMNLVQDIADRKDLERLYHDVMLVELGPRDEFYDTFKELSTPIEREYAPIAEEKRRGQKAIAEAEAFVEWLKERDKAMGVGSGGGPYSGSPSYHYDPYDADDYDDPDDFADEWAEEFGDGDEEAGWDEAWDYWHDRY